MPWPLSSNSVISSWDMSCDNNELPQAACYAAVLFVARHCDLLIGHNMAWRTSILKSLRFAEFYEHYPTYVLYDDQDISLRARRTFRLIQCGSAQMWHKVSPGGRPPGFHYGFQTVF